MVLSEISVDVAHGGNTYNASYVSQLSDADESYNSLSISLMDESTIKEITIPEQERNKRKVESESTKRTWGSRPKDTSLLKEINFGNGMVNKIQHRTLPSHEWQMIHYLGYQIL